jgi:transposase InsO family protein
VKGRIQAEVYIEIILIANWNYYNHGRGHSALDDRTPDEVYYGLPLPYAEAA